MQSYRSIGGIELCYASIGSTQRLIRIGPAFMERWFRIDITVRVVAVCQLRENRVANRFNGPVAQLDRALAF